MMVTDFTVLHAENGSGVSGTSIGAIAGGLVVLVLIAVAAVTSRRR